MIYTFKYGKNKFIYLLKKFNNLIENFDKILIKKLPTNYNN